ncbi:MAG: hypothetical protein F6J89_08520 [Symploca sp. SIO1C4]|uniref:Uncharacterized protein n=1 Tax=Symploca sp. SIO1C4 TaxID=2607765 RepID=A0A6B3N9V9_9CYAN|nr:hypothetical protein [Symploca sp. SIO1C4]
MRADNRDIFRMGLSGYELGKFYPHPLASPSPQQGEGENLIFTPLLQFWEKGLGDEGKQS